MIISSHLDQRNRCWENHTSRQPSRAKRWKGLDRETESTRDNGLGALSGIGAISALGSLGGLHIKVEHYGESEELQTRLANSSSSEEEGGEEEENLNEQESGLQECESKLQKRRKRRKSQQKWERSRRIRLSTDSPSPIPLGENATLAENLATSANSPTNSTAMSASSVLKIKTEMAEPINFDNDSSIWNYPPNREISRNEPPYSMTAKPASTNNNGTPESFPSPQGQSVAIPDSVLTPPGNDGGGGATVRKTASFNGNSTPSSSASVTSLAPPSSVSSADPLSPPLSASPRDKQQTTPTTSSTSPASSCASSAPSSSGPAVLYSGDLEALQRLQAGNVVLPLVHRVSGTLAPTSTSAPRVYTTGTIRYAPADVTLAMAQGNLLPNAAVNFVDGSGFGLDPKTPMEMLYHHVHRLNMSAAAAGPFVGASTNPASGQVTTAEGLFSSLPFPVYSNGIHATQGSLERKED
ncbi:neuronal PAS domain-containing protein 3-like [Boleophthalmus pectinirostris]|uniref:neuronal PAS domain-containing protein 3-like n=1 Tax=Boleophthalmus pectinirostris TaxID=150288 RepID=UPI00242B2E26|nr:neuronal PAS domain-containing protein 3-like [Boleophthalmus pectinirostris]